MWTTVLAFKSYFTAFDSIQPSCFCGYQCDINISSNRTKKHTCHLANYITPTLDKKCRHFKKINAKRALLGSVFYGDRDYSPQHFATQLFIEFYGDHGGHIIDISGGIELDNICTYNWHIQTMDHI